MYVVGSAKVFEFLHANNGMHALHNARFACLVRSCVLLQAAFGGRFRFLASALFDVIWAVWPALSSAWLTTDSLGHGGLVGCKLETCVQCSPDFASSLSIPLRCSICRRAVK